MCWSASVAGFFAIAEFAVLAYLWKRNRLFDRGNARLHLPVVLQELLQAFLWPHVSHSRNEALGWEDPALHVCSASNKMWGFLIVVTVAGLAPWFLSCSLFEMQDHNERIKRGGAEKREDWRHKIGEFPNSIVEQLRFVSKAAAVGHMTLLIVVLHQWFVKPAPLPPFDTAYVASCTSRGPHGHQIWPLVTAASWWIKVIRAGVYFAVCGGYNFLPRPSVLPEIFTVLSVVAVTAFLTLGDEWGSVWCWTGSLCCLVYVWEPQIYNWAHVFDSKYLEDSAEGERLRDRDQICKRLRTFMFWQAWSRMEVFGGNKKNNMTPWRSEQVRERQKQNACQKGCCSKDDVAMPNLDRRTIAQKAASGIVQIA